MAKKSLGRKGTTLQQADRDNEDEHAVRVLGWAARVATMGLQTCRTARRFGRLLDRLG